MKLLAVFLLVGLAFASAVPLFDDDLENELDQIADELGDEFIVYSEGGLGARLRKRFEELIERIKTKMDEGKGFDKELFKMAEDFYEKLKNLGVEVSEKFKQIFEDLRSKFKGNSSPQHADWQNWKERLRQLRDRIQNHQFDEAKIREFVERIFGKNEMTNQFLEILKTKGEKGKQGLIDWINRILGEKQEAFSSQHADWQNWKERLRQLRDRIQNHQFDEAKIREFVERIFGKNEMTNQFLEILKTKGEKGKQGLIDWINRILGETQEAFPFVDRLKEEFERMLENMKKAMDEGKTVSENMWKKAQDMYEKLSNLGVEFSEKVKQLFEDLKSKFGKNSVQQVEFSIIGRIKERLENLIGRMNKDMEDGKGVRGDLMKKLTDMFEKFKGLGGEMSQKFKDMFENLKSKFNKSSPVEHSVKEIYEKVKKFFRDLNIELKEKFVKFGEYVKEQYHKGLDKTKSDIDNIKNIAHKFVEDGRKISKDLAEEALEFFRQYKDDLGHIYEEVVDKVRDILKKED